MLHHEIVPAEPQMIDHIGAHMRSADACEVYLQSLMRPADALAVTVKMSAEIWAGLVDGEPVCVWGYSRPSILGRVARPWLLGTDAVERNARAFIRHSRPLLAQMRAAAPYLENYVHEENVLSKRWLSWMGFTIEDAEPHGPMKAPFHRFHIRGI